MLKDQISMIKEDSETDLSANDKDAIVQILTDLSDAKLIAIGQFEAVLAGKSVSAEIEPKQIADAPIEAKEEIKEPVAPAAEAPSETCVEDQDVCSICDEPEVSVEGEDSFFSDFDNVPMTGDVDDDDIYDEDGKLKI